MKDDYEYEEQNNASHSQQCYYDRADYANEQLERGEIDETQAAENIRNFLNKSSYKYKQ